LAKFRDFVEKKTGEVKDAFINVTSPNLKELENRVKMISDYGFRYFMIDVVVAGFGEVATACQLARDYKLAIHAHRAMHGMFTKNPKQGMSMLFLAKLMRLLGVDQLHTGTVIGKLAGDEKEIHAMTEMLRQREVEGIKGLRMPQNFYKLNDVLPVSSGGLHPGILHQIFDIYGTTDIGIQVGGGTLGHPAGILAGAKAVMQAIEAYRQGIPVQEYAVKHRYLREALNKWGNLKPV